MVIYDARPSAFNQMSTTGEWEYLWSAAGGISAIDGSVGSAMTPTLDTGGRNAVIADGVACVKGQLWRCDAPVSTPIPAASAQNRIDRLVLRLTRGATTSATVVQPVVITGTPSGSPVLPPIVQTTAGIWDLPISHWTSTSAGGLSGLIDDRVPTNDQWHDMRPLQNAFVGTVAGQVPPQYKFSDDCKFVEVAGNIQSPPTTGNYSGTNFFVFPPAYWPNVAPSGGNYRWAASNVADGPNATPMVTVRCGTGALRIDLLPTSIVQTTIGISGRYPLDSTAGFIQS